MLGTIPAALRWVSQEPQIERITYSDAQLEIIDWIVIGGESGPRARPFDLGWARWTIAQATEAGIPVFVKQLGAVPRETVAERDRRRGIDPTDNVFATSVPAALDMPVRLKLRDSKGGDISEWPEDLRRREEPVRRSA